MQYVHNEWIVREDQQLMPAGRVKLASLLDVSGWVVATWAAVPRDVVVHWYKKCGLSIDDDVLLQLHER